MKTAKLHELIQLAKEGKQFKATRTGLAEFLYDCDFKTCDSWSIDSILFDWEYQEVREPEVVDFDLTVNDSGFLEWHHPGAIIKLTGKKWRIVATEILEGE